ncbi:hypothetical protein PCASD_21753 [Puccinia coronata f. sp. avenae]|uniref:Uncharacterized protein n=1 Tax=Puccinia coronata f. sp. avenae TaxID=200324 RepID=A0A2N5T6L6_9BASI|nr:hypothetical protein PCASD_21753 [Puccinia coronata f. sp. avenae]
MLRRENFAQCGQEYLDMKEQDAKATTPTHDFCEFITGHKTIKKLTGLDPLSLIKKKKTNSRIILFDGKYNKGSRLENLADVKLLVVVTPRDGQAKLKPSSRNLELAYGSKQTTGMFCGKLAAMWDSDLQHLQLAIGEGWLELKGPNPDFDAVDAIDADWELDDEGSGRENNVATNKTKQTWKTCVSKGSKSASNSNVARGQKRGQHDTVCNNSSKRTCCADSDSDEDKEEEEDNKREEEYEGLTGDDGEDNKEGKDEEDDDEDDKDEEDKDGEDEEEDDKDEGAKNNDE